MTDYQIQPHTRRCVTTGRDLQPGERYYTALLEEGDRFVRQDFSSQAWQGPPAGAFSFWSGRVPRPDETVKPRFDDDALEECFQRLEGQDEPGRVNFRYVVALLLIRRKRFRFEQTQDRRKTPGPEPAAHRRADGRSAERSLSRPGLELTYPKRGLTPCGSCMEVEKTR
jgi:hypothetical protein